jgi:predicted protein tyrosine phosphatase
MTTNYLNNSNTSIKFSIFETEQIDFIVFNSPNRNNPSSVEELNKIVNLYNIQLIFRLCEELYCSSTIDNCQIIDMKIKDGSFPSENVINDFLSHIKNHIDSITSSKTCIKPCVGIHCRAGLGRAPIFTAIGLMNFTNYDDYSDIVKLIRQKINGSINCIQLRELSKYKPKYIQKKQKRCIIC